MVGVASVGDRVVAGDRNICRICLVRGMVSDIGEQQKTYLEEVMKGVIYRGGCV